MGFNSRLHPKQAKAGAYGSVATDGSAMCIAFVPERAGQLLSARFVNGNTATVASGTTAGSSLNVYVYKGTSGSVIGSARLGAVAALATSALTLSTSTSLTRFAAGDVIATEIVGGVGNDNDNSGCIIQVGYQYAYALDTTATP